MKREPPFQISDSYDAMSQKAAELIVAALRVKPELLLCAAGGTTPARTYELLGEQYRKEPNVFRAVRVVKLDEWGGLAMDDPGSCETQLRTQLLQRLDVPAKRYFGLRSDPNEPERECERIHELLAQEGPIDLCLLGLGANGHIGMNEPDTMVEPYVHIARLSETSLWHPMLANSKKRPAYGLTLGMADILTAREILLLVSGMNKREPFSRLMTRNITTEFPASFLWLHSDCEILCDKDAAEGWPAGTLPA